MSAMAMAVSSSSSALRRPASASCGSMKTRPLRLICSGSTRPERMSSFQMPHDSEVAGRPRSRRRVARACR